MKTTSYIKIDKKDNAATEGKKKMGKIPLRGFVNILNLLEVPSKLSNILIDFLLSVKPFLTFSRKNAAVSMGLNFFLSAQSGFLLINHL